MRIRPFILIQLNAIFGAIFVMFWQRSSDAGMAFFAFAEVFALSVYELAIVIKDVAPISRKQSEQEQNE